MFNIWPIVCLKSELGGWNIYVCRLRRMGKHKCQSLLCLNRQMKRMVSIHTLHYMCTFTSETVRTFMRGRDDPLLQMPLDKLRTRHVQICPSLTPQVPIDAACTSFLNQCTLRKSFRVSTPLIHALGNFTSTLRT